MGQIASTEWLDRGKSSSSRLLKRPVYQRRVEKDNDLDSLEEVCESQLLRFGAF